MPSSPLTATSSPLSEPPDESENKDANKSVAKARRSTRATLTENTSGQLLLVFLWLKSSSFSLAKKLLALSQPVVPPPVFYDKRGTAKGTSEVSNIL